VSAHALYPRLNDIIFRFAFHLRFLMTHYRLACSFIHFLSPDSLFLASLFRFTNDDCFVVVWHTIDDIKDALTHTIGGKLRRTGTFIIGLRPLSLLVTFLYWIIFSPLRAQFFHRINEPEGVISSLGLVSGRITDQ
jgi:hypothetical protein